MKTDSAQTRGARSAATTPRAERDRALRLTRTERRRLERRRDGRFEYLKRRYD